MAIDPSIPLQAKAPQMQDPLEQYGRVQSIKANQLALQEGQRKVQTQNAFRNALASGADLNDPAVFNKLMGIDPTAAMALQEGTTKIQQTQQATQKGAIENARAGLDFVNTPQAGAQWLTAQFKDPVMGKYFAAMGKTPEQSLAEYQQMVTQPGGFEKWRQQAAMGTEKMLQHLTAVRGQNITMRGQDITKRGQNMPKYVEGIGMVHPDGRVTPVVGAEGKAINAGQVAAETERGKLLAKQQAAAPAAIETAKAAVRKIDEMIGSVDGKIKQHPGFGTVGLNFFGRHIPGTPSSDFKIRHEEVTGQAFMQAYTTLKGSGQITEKEGEKATAAITRMNLSQSEAEYKRAAREFQAVLRAGIRRAEQTLGQNTARQEGPARTGTYNGRRVIMNPDGGIEYAD
jgi:hypothetical protein